MVETRGAKRRRTEAPQGQAQEDAPHPKSTGKSQESCCQEPPPSLGVGEPGSCGGGGGGVDYISALPDAILGEIISLLPINEGARTQTLASRWRHLWRSAPLSLDGCDLPDEGEIFRAGLISRILAAHQGPARRFSVSAVQLLLCPSAVDSWMRSPALHNLQELEFPIGQMVNLGATELSLPVATFQFSATLRVATFSSCHLPELTVEAPRFPQLRELTLDKVLVSEESLQCIIAGSSALNSLLLSRIYGFSCVRICSQSLISMGVRRVSGQLIIENAPSLERLLQLEQADIWRISISGSLGLHISIIEAPKLETLGWLSDRDYHHFKLAFGSGTTTVQELCSVSIMEVVCSVKILAIDIHTLSLGMVIDLMRCFPCLEKLYIESFLSGDKNLWRRKHRDVIKCLDIRLKTVVLKNYRGIKSHVNFASFFVLNAKMLESMTFEGGSCHDQKFVAEQQKLLELEKRASRSAQFYFTVRRFWNKNPINVKHVHDLSVADPFESSC